MQKPSLGRIVLARVDPAWNNGANTAPAIITRVWDEHPDGGWVVNLRIFVDTGSMPLSVTSARLVDTEDQARGLPHFAYWPPRV